MKSEIKKYLKQNLTVFSIDIKQKEKNGKYKKDIVFQNNWQKFTLEKSYYNENYNGLAMLSGEINGIIIIDIDNIEHWEKLLAENNKKEPKTVKAISGSGGLHYYFKYDKDLEEIKSKDHCFGKDYDIDVKTNGGCIICPPTSYFNKNLDKQVEYKWEKSIFDYEPKQLPDWIKNLLFGLKQKEKAKEKVKEEIQGEITEETIESIIDYNEDDIESFVNMLNEQRSENYNDWINVGLCLHNLSKHYFAYWKNFSKQSKKYDINECREKWESFGKYNNKEKNNLKIGSLLYWAKNDNPIKYEDYHKKKKISSLIVAKFPNEKLQIGKTQEISKTCSYVELQNKECILSGCCHKDLTPSMYIEMVANNLAIKCRHTECFGKIYPCEHIQLTKQETNLIFNGDITININQKDDELVEFQQINLFETQELNELVYNGLNGKSSQFAEIIFHFFGKEYNYGEDNNWYCYDDHKWKNIGVKNSKLRIEIQKKLKTLYKQLYEYYKNNENNKKNINFIKQIIGNFGETMMKNNIMTELIDLFIETNNPKRDFTKKLDNNKYLIGFDNGVYDLIKFEFRNGIPEDNITLSTGYNYNDTHTEKFNDLLRFLQDIQPNKEERDYMLTYLSVCLLGNQLELFTILTGNGRNGKSKLVELLKLTFGEYFGSVQSQLFTRPRPDANSPDPGLLSLSKKKIVIASEPEKNSKLNSGFIKFITGRDSTTLRNCHSNDMVDFKPNFVTFLICNDIPDCDDIDNALSKRLRCINFPTEFVLDPKKENEKKIDTDINENFDYWKLDFILLLIEHYKNYTETKKLLPTENILKWTNQYKENTDLYLQFINEFIIETDSEDDRIHFIEMYEVFKSWFKNNNPNVRIPSDKEFGRNIKKYKLFEESIRINDKVRKGLKKHKIRYND
jgi:P4 family phage/plasmid primase-like protien